MKGKIMDTEIVDLEGKVGTPGEAVLLQIARNIMPPPYWAGRFYDTPNA